MKIRFLTEVAILLAVLVLRVFAGNCCASQAVSEIVRLAKKSVVTIETYTENKKPIGIGTGFYYGESGCVVTNYHVANGASYINIKTENGDIYIATSVVSYDEINDLIMLKTDTPINKIKLLQHNITEPLVTDDVVVIGSPKGLELSVSTGIVSGIRNIDQGRSVYQITAPISPGSSGSPVLNMSGEFIGVVSYQYVGGQNLNFAIPSKYVFNLKKLIKPITTKTWGKRLNGENEIVADGNYLNNVGTLLINASPKNATVIIKNYKAEYYDGVSLPEGDYNIEVSLVGFVPQSFWVNLVKDQNTIKSVNLVKLQTVAKFINSIGQEFLEVKGTGSYGYRLNNNYSIRQPVEIKDFYIQKTEVTQGQWLKVMGNNPSFFADCGQDCPVENISWKEASSFVKKLNDLEKTSAYRLPTEAEWEYASIGGGNHNECWNKSGEPIEILAWYNLNSNHKTNPVGGKKPNSLGLFDMFGNVWEMCSDYFLSTPGILYSADITKLNYLPRSSFERRVVKGGDWDSVDNYLNCYSRDINIPGELHIKTEPNDAIVKIIDKNIGYYDGIKLFPGSYSIKVTAPYYHDYKLIVDIVGGVSQEQIVYMRRKPDLNYGLDVIESKKISDDGYHALSKMNYFSTKTKEDLYSEFFALKGADAIGVTERGLSYLEGQMKSFENELSSYTQKKIFKDLASSKIRDSVSLLRLHEIVQNLDVIINDKEWKSPRVGFRVVKDIN